MNKYLRGLQAFWIVLVSLGGLISVISVANLSGAYDPSGALAWIGIGAGLLGFGVLTIVLRATAAAIVAGKDAPAVAPVPTVPMRKD